ncbi:MAG: nucleotidyltransferase substrate binding protein [Nitrospirae bacterium]|nr:nucleotidyltransferase substrate binding protein [Nitrospirota bacterium]
MKNFGMDTRQLEDAVARLGEMLDEHKRMGELPEVLQDAVSESLMHRFEYTTEMAWKTAKRYLTEVEGYDNAVGPKTVMRICGELGLLDPEKWFLYLEARQNISHDYSGSKTKAVLDAVDEFYAEARRFLEVLKGRVGWLATPEAFRANVMKRYEVARKAG